MTDLRTFQPAVDAVIGDPFADGPSVRALPTTAAQREIWSACQLGTDASCAYNESVAITLRGALDATALRAALQRLVDRHESLRATVGADGTTFYVSDAATLAWTWIDLAGHAAADAALDRLREAEVTTPFDLERGPLLRATLVRLDDGAHVLLLTAHHVVCDGWSFGVLVRELGALYDAACAGTDAPLLPAPSWTDHVTRLADDVAADESEQWWLEQLTPPPAALELPRDRARPPLRTFAAARVDHVLDAKLVAALREHAARAGQSLFSLLLAGLCATLRRVTGQGDVVVGITAAGQALGGTPALVGHCVNVLPVRAAVDDGASFASLALAVRGLVLDAVDHGHCTLGTLLERLALPRDPSRIPLVPLLFNLDPALDATAHGYRGLSVTVATVPRRYEGFELFVSGVESAAGITLECQYNTALFDEAGVRRRLRELEVLLRGAMREPTRAVRELPLLDDADRAALAAWNATGRPLPSALFVHALVAAQAARTPAAAAVVAAGGALSYAELDARANRIAHRLRALGVGPGVRVALAVERSHLLPVAMLAVLKAGGAYIPIDHRHPAERVRHVLAHALPAVLLTELAVEAALPSTGLPVLRLDADAAAIDAEPSVAPQVALTGEDAAYVIYTSGSTGTPKGVVVPHRAVANFAGAMADRPGLAAGDALLAVTTFAFDIAVLELLLPLVVGARVVVASADDTVDGDRLLALVRAHGVTHLQATPSTWRLLLAAGWSASEPLVALVGGEALPVDVARALLQRARAVWNMYGPTETTVWSTCAQLTSADAPLPIGCPIANTRCHVLDANREPVPVGVEGELWIAGAGVALGYLHEPALTAERFVTDRVDGGTMYRTGDVVRRLADGSLTWVRRVDTQVKVRGHRIELEEIEAVLAQHPDVAATAATVQEPRPGDVRVVAAWVARPGAVAESDALRAHLQRLLPEYMVPQHLVRLTALPLTANGKVDRRALPQVGAPALPVDAGFVAPATDLEHRLAALWCVVLDLPRIGTDADFFELGGYSLLGAQLLAHVRRELGVALPLRALFEAPTIAQLARRIDVDTRDSGASDGAGIPHLADDASAPLSLQQQRLWFLEQFSPGNPTFNLPAASRLRGRLDVAALRDAIEWVVARHEPLRTTFVVDGAEPVQRVHPCMSVELPVIDLAHDDAPGGDRRLAALLERDALVPIDLGEAMVRFRLYRLAEDEHVLALVAHHAAWDGWSFDVFWRDLALAYAALRAGTTPAVPPLPVRYRDWAAWQRATLRGDALARHREYWLRQLAGPLPVLQLPTDHPRPPVRSERGDRLAFELPAQLMARVRAHAAARRTSPFMILLATYATLLHRWSGQEEIVVGTPVRGRERVELERLIGFFVDVVALRIRLAPGASFADTLAEVTALALEGFAHQDMPFELLVQELRPARDLSRTPVYQTIFSYQDGRDRPSTLDDLALEQLDFSPGTAQCDLGLWFLDLPDRTIGALDFSTDLLERATVARLRDQFLTLLDAALAAPATPLAHLALLPAGERRLLLEEWNATARPLGDETLVSLVAARAEAAPTACALAFDGARLDYGSLIARADVIASTLAARGIGRGDVVAVCLDRGLDLVPTLLGVLRAGAAYLPLDPEFPPERLAYMLIDAGARLLLTTHDLGAIVPPGTCEVAFVNTPMAADRELPGLPSPDDLAYVIYTSGSTGLPKGVEITHRALANFLDAMRETPGLAADDVLVAVTTPTFDIAALELFLPLVVGARIEIASREVATDGAALAALLARAGATLLQATPATWRLLLDAGWAGSAGLTAMCGGESLAPELARALAPRVRRLVNVYGPTETTVWSTLDVIDPATLDTVTIGRPIANTRVYVCTPHGELAPVGVPGELYIGGAGVARGYRGCTELTRQRFVPDPFHPGGRLYRTGDRARWRADGRLEHLGRLDLQIKVRGHRIEPGEIEEVLTAHEAVRQVVVGAREVTPGDVRLVAWVVFADGEELTGSELRRHARRQLPSYMIPGIVVPLDAMPLTPNGKVDRRALPDPFGHVAAAPRYEPPRTPTELVLADVWRALLHVDRIGADDNFFDLGGHSLLSMSAVHAIEQRLGRRMNPRAMFFRSLRQLAAALDEEVAA